MPGEETLKEIRDSLKPEPTPARALGVDAETQKLREKVEVLSTQLDAVERDMKQIDAVVDDLLKRSLELNAEQAALYRKLAQVLPEVVRGIGR